MGNVPPSQGGKATAWIIAATGTLTAAAVSLIWIFRHLPLTDFPQYLLLARILASYSDPAYGFETFFTVESPWKPYSGTFFALTLLLEPVIGILASGKLYLSLSLILTSAAFWLWLKKVFPGREPQAVPATLLLFSPFFYIGLMNYLFSVPFFLLALTAGWELSHGRGRARFWTLLLAVSLTAAYFSHIVTFAFALLLLGLQWALLSPRKALAWHSLGMLPSLAFFTAYFVGRPDKPLASALQWSNDPLASKGAYMLMPFGVFRDPLADAWRLHSDQVPLWTGFFLICAWAAWKGRGRKRGPALSRGSKWLAAILISSTLWFPSDLGQWAVSFRFSYLGAFALLAILPCDWSRDRRLRAAMILLCAAAPLTSAYRYWLLQPEMQDMERALQAIPRRQVVQSVVTQPHVPPYWTYPLLHVADWYCVFRGGANPYTFARFRYLPVKEKAPIAASAPGEFEGPRFRFSKHAQGTDYFLVRTLQQGILSDLESNLPLAAHFGVWRVYGPNPNR